MRYFTRMLRLIAVMLLSALSLLAQNAVDPSGHWEGTISAPNMDVTVALDLAKNAKGQLAGTFSQPNEGIKGLPLSSIAVDGQTVRMLLKAGTGGGTFNGALSTDGKTLSGEFVTAEGGYSVPFNLTRKGDAQIAPAPRSAPIAKELEGAWNGALDVGGRQMRIILTLANHADGTATGTIVSPDGSGVEIPIAMAQKAANFTVEIPSIGASFAGVLNATGTELAGQWTQGGSSLPLTLKRAKP